MGLKITIEIDGSDFDPDSDGHDPARQFEKSTITIEQGLDPMNGPSLIGLQKKFNKAVDFTRQLLSGNRHVDENLPF